ncbi:MAG: DNA polymerase I [Clostridia bacterium]|nr:DNA polymerase I [Clostridia bacterium]
MNNTFLIIDGNSLINRAYYAVQRPMITKEGIYTQGIYGFLNMLQKLEKEYEPEYIAVTFDVHAPTFRHEKYSEYKAGRKHMPPELLMEMPILKDVLHAMNIKTFEMAGWEADDLIGTLARIGEEKGLSPLIVSGDRDQLQLATDTTKVLYTKSGVSVFELYDKDAFFKKYEFMPLQFIDYKGIFGDKSDNIPGIPGIGEKGAKELILQFGSVEKMIEHADKIEKKGLRTKVEDNADLARLSKELATINRFAPVEIEISDVRRVEPDYDRLIELYKKLEFTSFLRKLVVPEKKNEDFVSFDEIEINPVATDNLEYFRNREVFIKVFSDMNHIQKPEITGIFIMDSSKYIYIENADKELIDELSSLNLKLFCHDVKNNVYPLVYYGFRNYEVSFDTVLASYVLDPSKSNYGLNELALDMLHRSLPDESSFIGQTQITMFGTSNEKYIEYGILTGKTVWQLSSLLKNDIEEQGLHKVLYEIELPLVKVLASMEVTGIRIDPSYLDEFSSSIASRIAELENSIWNLAGEKFNIKSTQQLGVILFEKLGLESGKKTKTGYSTSAEVLEKLKDSHEIIPNILEYRNLTKLQSTYVDGMKPLISKDSRIRAHFNQTVTQTGRISCTEPNLQNIPIRQELGRKLRNAFLADDGYTLIGADYSQIELRVLAHLSEDESLVSAFNNGEDIHKLTASRVLGIPMDQVTSLDRSKAKAVNFGVIYGMSQFGLSEELNIPRKDAEEYIREYFYKHPKVKEYMDLQKEFAKDKGYSLTFMGRKRTIPEIKSSNFMVRSLGERLAMNSPIQGSAADIIKLAMIKVYNELEKNFPDSKLILQVHDELIINAKKDDREAIMELLRRNMEEAVSLIVKLEVSLNTADNWYELK